MPSIFRSEPDDYLVSIARTMKLLQAQKMDSIKLVIRFYRISQKLYSICDLQIVNRILQEFYAICDMQIVDRISQKFYAICDMQIVDRISQKCYAICDLQIVNRILQEFYATGKIRMDRIPQKCYTISDFVHRANLLLQVVFCGTLSVSLDLTDVVYYPTCTKRRKLLKHFTNTALSILASFPGKVS